MSPDSFSIMDFEVRDLLWLLLPLAAASGWYAAHREKRRRLSASADSLSPEYFRGVNFLLNEQPDKAIEVFTQILEVNSETVETHLALGSLFRRRGEVERAIRIHQNLVARPTLGKTQRAQALFELAQDYQKAGLLDRAEQLFLDLTDIPEYVEQALQALMHIYEQEREWDKAISTVRRMATADDSNLQRLLAQYHCELGEDAWQAGSHVRAKKHVEKALKIDPGCVRANILAGKILVNQGQDQQAIAVWKRIEQQDATYLDEVIDDIATASRRLNDQQAFYNYLSDVIQRQPGLRTLRVYAEQIYLREGKMAAQEFVTSHLRQKPSVLGLKQLIDLQIAQPEISDRENLDHIKVILDQLAAQQEGYQCQQCGFHAQALHWQCPACHEWMTMQPAACSVSLGYIENRDVNTSKINDRN